MNKVTIKFPLKLGETDFPAGSIILLPVKRAEWLCAQRIDEQPCAVPYTGEDPAANEAQ